VGYLGSPQIFKVIKLEPSEFMGKMTNDSANGSQLSPAPLISGPINLAPLIKDIGHRLLNVAEPMAVLEMTALLQS